MKPPVPPNPKGLGKKQIPQPEWSKVDPIEDKPIGDNKKLAAYIAKSQAPTPEEQQESMAEQTARQLASLRSRKAQEATGLPPLRLVRQEGRDPVDETAPETPMTPEQLAAMVRLMQPTPEDQQEQLEQALRSRGSPRKQAMATNLEQSKALAAIMQDNLVKTTELREKQAHLIELLKSGTKPELLDVLTDLLVGPTPEEQAEQEAAAEMMAALYRSHQSKKGPTTS